VPKSAIHDLRFERQYKLLGFVNDANTPIPQSVAIDHAGRCIEADASWRLRRWRLGEGDARRAVALDTCCGTEHLRRRSEQSESRPHVIVVGSGGRPYREYAFATLARRYRVSAVLPSEPTWQHRYLSDSTIADLADPNAIALAVSALAGDAAEAGLLTWDETVLEATAQAAEKLGLPHMSAQAAARCRDKYATRTLLEQAGLASVRHRLVSSAQEAIQCAESFGYPVVVKPRALAGSLGVALAEDAAAVHRAFALAESSRFADLPTGHGVLVEEYLDGPEISVDSVVFEGQADCVHVARKRLGFEPYFEEVGHLVTEWYHEPWAQPVRELVVQTHHVLGVTHGVTHAEIRLTREGPRLVELNGRLGGDLIPFISAMATGMDLVAAAAELALGRRRRSPTGPRSEVRFVYPPDDCVVGSVEWTEPRGCRASRTLRCSPSRAAACCRRVIRFRDWPRSSPSATRDCARLLDEAERAVVARLEPLAVSLTG
jgi:biotin carboxylase